MYNKQKRDKYISVLATAFILVIMAIIRVPLKPIEFWNFSKRTEKQGVDEEGTMILKLNYDLSYQTIEGFGASGAWWAQDVGGWDNIGDIMELLYDHNKGIGLNIYRYNIGAGEPCKTGDVWRRTKSLEVTPGIYDLERDKNAIVAMKEAVKRGAEVVAFANSPPARLTVSGKTSGGEKGKPNLAPEAEEDFAHYLVDITQLLLDEEIPVRYLSPINEPQWDWKEGQEGSNYKPEQIISLSKKVALEIERRNLPVKISMAESGTWNDDRYTLNLYKRIMDDDILSNVIDHYAVHSYWSSAKDKKIAALYFDRIDNMLPLHQTEWCEMENGIDMGMDSALTLAKTVHEDMTILSVASWQHWLAVSKYDYRDGLVYVDQASKKYRPAKRMWSLGNYSKFIKPGYQRINLDIYPKGEANQDGKVLASAYFSPKEDKTIIVAINESQQEKPIKFDQLKGDITQAFITSEDYDCALVDEIKKLDDYTLPAKSVVTFVILNK